MANEDGFLFFNASNPSRFRDKDIQRAIRKRVMRDIGKARRKIKRPPAMTFVWQTSNVTPPSIPERPAPSLTCYPLPVDMDSRALELIHFMNAEAEYNFRPFRKIWFSMALQDESAFLLCKANAAMFLEETRYPHTFRYEKCQETLTYYGQCVRQVTDRLSDPIENTGMGVIICILGLICHDLYVGTLDRWAYHIQGLAEIIQIRGGYWQLDENIQLLCSWFDVLGSVTRDTPPKISSYPITLDILDAPMKSTSKHLQFELLLGELQVSPLNMPHFVMVLQKVRVLADFVNKRYDEDGFWKAEDDISPLQALTPITHDLLLLPQVVQLAVEEDQIAVEMTRLALLILLSGLKAKYGFSSAEMPTLHTKLSRLVQQASIFHTNIVVRRLQLWALVIGALFQPTEPVQSQFVEGIISLMISLDLTGGAAVLNYIRDTIWIEIIERNATEQLIHDINTFDSFNT